MKPGKLFVVSAPSGAGKSSLVRAVLDGWQKAGRSLEQVISYTTRPARPGEVDGVHYHFTSEAEFKRKLNQRFFLEWSTAYGAYYGAPAHILDGLADGHSYVLIIDREGARQVRERHPQAILIWISVSDPAELRRRLEGRGTEGAAAVERRLVLAQQEMAKEKTEPLYAYHVLNDDFADAQRQLEGILRQELGG